MSDSENLLDNLFRSPAVYFPQLDPVAGKAVALRMDRNAYQASSFLDRRTRSLDGKGYLVELDHLADEYRRMPPSDKPVNYIFHTAFCGSTLLARLLDIPGKTMVYKEPAVLQMLAWFRREKPEALAGMSDPDWLRLSHALNSRTFAEPEVAVVKPTDSCINLAADLLSLAPGNAAVLLYQDLGSFIIAMLKSPERQKYLANILRRSQQDARAFPVLANINPATLSQGQAAAYAWACLLARYQALLATPDLPVKSLNADDLFDRTEAVLTALTAHFALPIGSPEIRSQLEGPLMARDAKETGQSFDAAAQKTRKAEQQAALQRELDEARTWLRQTVPELHDLERLPRDLLGA